MFFKRGKKSAIREALINNYHVMKGKKAKIVMESDGERITVEADGHLATQLYMTASLLAKTYLNTDEKYRGYTKDIFDAYYEMELERLEGLG